MYGKQFTTQRKLLPLSCSQSVNIVCAVAGEKCVQTEVRTGVCPSCVNASKSSESGGQKPNEPSFESAVSFPNVTPAQWEAVFGLQEGTSFSEGISRLDLAVSADFVLGKGDLQLGAEIGA